MFKKYRPITPGTRQLVLPTHGSLTRVEGKRATVEPTKSLHAAEKTNEWAQ